MRLLIVGGGRELHERTAAAFFRDDYELVHSYDHAHALRSLRLTPRDFDALVLGDTGPGHDALAFIDDVQQSLGRHGHPPIVLFWALSGVRSGAKARGVQFFAEQGAGAIELRLAVRAAVSEGWRQVPGRSQTPASEGGACECGALHTSFPDHHSSWCPAYEA